MRQVLLCTVIIRLLLGTLCGCSVSETSPKTEAVIPEPPLSPETEQPQPELMPDTPEDPEEENPLLVQITELQYEYLVASQRAEYIEFKVLAAGNLKGLQVHIMYEANNPFIYNFPPVDVAEGEYITLHLRTYQNTCIDELGNNLSLSGGNDSCPTARDLWAAGTLKRLHQTDIVILQESNGVIHDAVCMNGTPGKPWNKNQSHFTAILEDLKNKSAWKSPDGVDISTASIYKSVNRYEGVRNTHSIQDWYIGGTSPGLANK